MSWLQLSIDTAETEAPLLELLFESLGAVSVTLTDAGAQPLLEPAPGEQRLWQNCRVIGLFEGDTDLERLRAALHQSLKRDITRSLRVEPVQDRAWERVWLEHFHPIRFGEHLWICPAGQHPEDEEAIRVELDPGLAFGTGTHPTTALCLEWLTRTRLHDMELIDYGCGSGILAVAALRLGARRVIAVDHDPQALEATRDNGAKNHVGDRLSTHLPEQTPNRAVDRLVANILAAPLIDLAPRFRELLRPGGRFALSGLLVEQHEAVSAAYLPFAELDPIQQRGEWMLLSGHKRRT